MPGNRMRLSPAGSAAELHGIKAALKAHMAAGIMIFFLRHINDIGMGYGIQRVMAQETCQIGEQCIPGYGQAAPVGQGHQEIARACRMHRAAATVLPLPQLISEPDIWPQKRKIVRIIRQTGLNLLRQ